MTALLDDLGAMVDAIVAERDELRRQLDAMREERDRLRAVLESTLGGAVARA